MGTGTASRGRGAGENAGSAQRSGRWNQRLGCRAGRRMGSQRPGRDHHAAPEVPVERARRLLVPHGDRWLGKPSRTTGTPGRDSFGRSVCLGRVTVGLQWWRRFGPDRPLHGTAHDALMAIPIIGRYFRSMGVLPAAPDAIATALAEGRDVALWPGGEVDSLRPWTERDRANLAGRKGFVKMAIGAGVPIVPIATVGGADAMPVLIRGDRLSQALRLDRLLRLKVFPLAVSLPWGIAPAALPQLPLPAKIRTRFMPAVELDHDPTRTDDEQYVDRKYREAQDCIQDGM